MKDKKVFFASESELLVCNATRKKDIVGRRLKEAYFGYLSTLNYNTVTQKLQLKQR
ncbi:hypothetical protein [Methanosarcina sp. 2.H.A.1B.4]|jgi:hypothetical protein|uniref:hypothetical protein n=1 Tax=Methanosarcina sp. 2.H.A.1B.4 TaxID=1483600 RepID=UPI0012E00BF6|nr:hypothetical protein [Methanosarcina sp. 2.H.A.1B.4]